MMSLWEIKGCSSIMASESRLHSNPGSILHSRLCRSQGLPACCSSWWSCWPCSPWRHGRVGWWRLGFCCWPLLLCRSPVGCCSTWSLILGLKPCQVKAKKKKKLWHQQSLQLSEIRDICSHLIEEKERVLVKWVGGDRTPLLYGWGWVFCQADPSPSYAKS